MVTTCSICGTTEAVDPGKFIKCNHRSIMEERKSSFIGCGGREMKAITEDGREIFSNNWWHQGDIPERFLKLIDKSHFAKWVR